MQLTVKIQVLVQVAVINSRGIVNRGIAFYDHSYPKKQAFKNFKCIVYRGILVLERLTTFDQVVCVGIEEKSTTKV